MEIDLVVILDQLVVVALGALQIHAQKKTPHIAGHPGIIGRILSRFFESFRIEKSRAPIGDIPKIGPDDFASHLVPRLVFFERILQPGGPMIVLTSAFHEMDVKPIAHRGSVFRLCEEEVNGVFPFFRGRIGQKIANLRGGRNHSGKIEMDSAEKFGIIRDRGGS